MSLHDDVREFNERHETTLTEQALVLAEESGEACEAVLALTGRKLFKEQGAVDDLVDELAQVIYTAYSVAERAGVDAGLLREHVKHVASKNLDREAMTDGGEDVDTHECRGCGATVADGEGGPYGECAECMDRHREAVDRMRAMGVNPRTGTDAVDRDTAPDGGALATGDLQGAAVIETEDGEAIVRLRGDDGLAVVPVPEDMVEPFAHLGDAVRAVYDEDGGQAGEVPLPDGGFGMGHGTVADLDDGELADLVRETPEFRAIEAAHRFADEASALRENDAVPFDRLVQATHERHATRVRDEQDTREIIETFIDVLERYSDHAYRHDDAVDAAASDLFDGGSP